MLGLERVLTESPPRTATGTELRRHQVDALAGMLAELIATTQRSADENGNGRGTGSATTAPAPRPSSTRKRTTTTTPASSTTRSSSRRFHGADPGAVRRYRFRHPTASGKTIAAAGFVEAARGLGVLILTHRRLLVSQFNRDLTTEGYGDRFTDAILKGNGPPRDNPITIQTYAWFARHGARARSQTSTTSSSATRPTRLSARRRARRSAPSPTRSSSG